MNLSIRPMTPAERMYSYNQSCQLMSQTGCIGHLRADFGSSGRKFYSTWDDHSSDLKTDDFKSEFDEVINALRADKAYGGILASRGKLGSYCHKHPESSYGPDSREYGFRVDSALYAYLLRLNPNPGEYNLYAYCYVREWLDSHLKKAEQGIRFITPDYTELFRIPDGGKIRITTAEGKTMDHTCRFIDETHAEIGRHLFHICQFAELTQRAGSTVAPLRSASPASDDSQGGLATAV